MNQDHRIGECRACRARFRIPSSFRAERARCRECGGMVVIGGPEPVQRSGRDRRQHHGEQRGQTRGAERGRTPDHAREHERRDVRRDDRRRAPPPDVEGLSPRPIPNAGEGTVRAPAIESPSARPPQVAPAPVRPAAEARAEPVREKKPGGVISSILSAVWRKKRDKRT